MGDNVGLGVGLFVGTGVGVLVGVGEEVGVGTTVGLAVGVEVGDVVENMGAKVVSVEEELGMEGSCRIDASSRSAILADELAKVFGCEIVYDAKMAEDLVINVGGKFNLLN